MQVDSDDLFEIVDEEQRETTGNTNREKFFGDLPENFFTKQYNVKEEKMGQFIPKRKYNKKQTIPVYSDMVE